MSFSWTAVLKIPWYQFRGMCDMELSLTLEFTIRFLLFSLKNPVLCGPCHETGMLSSHRRRTTPKKSTLKRARDESELIAEKSRKVRRGVAVSSVTHGSELFMKGKGE